LATPQFPFLMPPSNSLVRYWVRSRAGRCYFSAREK
jgi:hypothetical protein